MSTDTITDPLVAILRKEGGFYRELAALQQKLQDALLARSWASLENTLSAMTRLADDISSAEDERQVALAALRSSYGLHEGCGLMELVARLPESEGKGLREEYRALRGAVLTVKSAAGGIGSYASSASATLREMLEEFFPHRKGKLYTKKGVPRAAREDALVVDHHL